MKQLTDNVVCNSPPRNEAGVTPVQPLPKGPDWKSLTTTLLRVFSKVDSLTVPEKTASETAQEKVTCQR